MESELESESESGVGYEFGSRPCFNRDEDGFGGGILGVRGAGIGERFDALCWDFTIGASRSSVEDSSRVESFESVGLDEDGLIDLGPRSIALTLG